MKKVYFFVFPIVILLGLFIGFLSANSESELTSKTELSLDEFFIVTFEPEGKLPEAVKYPSVYVQFSKPVVPLTALGTPSDESPYMSIEPPIEGVYRWFGTSLLSFEASEASIPQKEYHVNIADDVKSVDGDLLSGEKSFSFKTEALRLLSIMPGYGAIAEGRWVDTEDVPIKDATDILLTFSWDVNPAVVAKYISVTADDAPLAFDVAKEGEKMLRLTLTENPPENTHVLVKLKVGARSEEDYLGTEKEQSKSFHTITPFELNYIDTDTQSYSKYTNPVYLNFSHQLSDQNIEEIINGISTVPEMPITADNVEIRGRELAIYGLPVEFGQTYSLEIPGIAQDIYSRNLPTAEPILVEVEVPPARSYAYFKDSGFKMLEAEFAPKLVFEHQNILAESYYSVRGIDNDDVEPSHISLNPDSIPQNVRYSELIDLAPFLQKNENGLLTGSVFFDAYMNYRSRSWRGEYNEYTRENELTLQVTDLGLTVRYGYNKVLVLVTSLSTGEPVVGADVEVFSANYYQYNSQAIINRDYDIAFTAKTNSDGLAVITLDDGEYLAEFDDDYLYVRATKGGDSAVFRPTGNYMRGGGASLDPDKAENTSMETFMFTDRGLYKPGETMTFRGIDRNLQLGNYTPYEGDYEITIQKSSYRSQALEKIEGISSASGGFFGEWKIPEKTEPGQYSITYSRSLPNGYRRSETQYFSVQFFERLRFEASVAIPNLTYISGDRLEASLQASYLGGGSLAESRYNFSWYRKPAYFRPIAEGFDDYKFGPSTAYSAQTYLSDDSGSLNAEGKASLGIDSGNEREKGVPYYYEVEASVSDAGNQQISTSTTHIVHPAQFYIGLSPARNVKGFAKKEQVLDFDYVLVKADSTLPSDADLPRQEDERKIKIELLREEWKAVQQMGVSGRLNTRYVNELVTEETKILDLTTGTELGKVAGAFTITPPKGGAYILRLTTTDFEGRDIITERFFYVTGSDWYFYRGNQSQRLTLTPDKNEYFVGDTAQILLNSPLPSGRYLLTVEREGIFSEKIIELDDPTTVIDIPIEENYVPVVYVALSSYSTRTTEPTHDFSTPDLDKPKEFFGITALHINTDARRFDIEIISDKKSYRPGETVSITLKATKDDVPVSNAEITLMAVDRGVIDLINYHVPDPVDYFYASYKFPNCIEGGDSRSLLIDPVTYEVTNLFGGDGESEEKIEERKNFDPTAVFEPYLLTGEDGAVTHTFTLPDNLTSYRITAVGVQKNDFSLSEAEIDANNPISVRDVLPRRLREGDIAETGVVISNLDDVAHDVTIDLSLFEGAERSGIAPRNDGLSRADGLATIQGNAKQTITVQPNTTVPLMFYIQAKTFGFVTLEFTVSSEIINERILKPLEIERPYMYETVTTVGELQAYNRKETLNEKIIIPDEANITLSLAPDLLGTLNDAVQYLFRYPYGCYEQRLSAMLPLIVFGDYIDVFGLESEVSNPKKAVETELATLAPNQKYDGGFPYWANSEYSSLAVSMRFAEIIAKAEEQNINVPRKIDIRELANYINNETNDLYDDAPTSTSGNVSYNRAYSVFMRAYGLYTMQGLGYLDKDDAMEYVGALVDDVGGDIASLSLCGLIYTNWGEIDKAVEIEQRLSSYFRPNTRGIDVTAMLDVGNSSWSFFNSKSERYALLLQFYTELNAASSNIAYSNMTGRLIYELLQQQKASKGYWTSTATTARVLIAFDEYIQANELLDTDFSANAFLADTNILSAEFEGLGEEPVTRIASFAELVRETGIAAEEENTLAFKMDGKGSLFYTLSMQYPISIKEQTYRDEGLNVFVDIKDAQTGEIIFGDELIAGRVYRTTVILSSTRDRTFVALRVPIPAGAEVMNAAFVTTGNFEKYEASASEDNSYNYGLSSQTIYDNEVQYFWNYFNSGFQQVEFLFRAVRKGTYNTPAAQAECMYEPEVFGRFMGRSVTIE